MSDRVDGPAGDVLDARLGTDAAAGHTGGGVARVLRGTGAVLLWLAAESLFFIPTDWRALAGLAPYRPVVAPALGALLNLAVAAAFVWWMALRPAARRDPRRRATFRLRAPAPGTWPRVAAAALGAGLAANAAMLVLPRFLRLPRNSPLEIYDRVPGSSLALLALAAVLAPLLEEFFFRGWAQGALERRWPGRGRPAWAAILVVAAVFAAAHGDAFGLVPRFGLAVASGYAAWATRSIWPSVALHAAYNASLFVGSALYPGVLPTPPAMEAWADPERAALFYWANDPRVFVPAVLALAGGAAVIAWALAGLPRRAAVAAGAGGGGEVLPAGA